MDDVLRHTVAGLTMTPRYSRPSLSSCVDAAREDNSSMEAEMQVSYKVSSDRWFDHGTMKRLILRDCSRTHAKTLDSVCVHDGAD